MEQPLRPRNRRSPSSDRFLTFLSPPNHPSPSLLDGDLDEDDVFWTGDFSQPPAAADRRQFLRRDTPGILAALSDTQFRRPIVCRKPLALPMVPKEREREEREYSQSAPVRKFLRSAPVIVPVAPVRVLGGDLGDVEDDEEEREEEMLPPHEIASMMHTTTFSVLEGVGRTLKGRDLRQVRNAVWRQTGFLD